MITNYSNKNIKAKLTYRGIKGYEDIMSSSQGVKATYVGPTYEDTNPQPTVRLTEEPTEEAKGEDGNGSGFKV